MRLCCAHANTYTRTYSDTHPDANSDTYSNTHPHADPYAEETTQAREIFQSLYAKLTLRQKAAFQLRRVGLPAKWRNDLVK